jgi:hypothetical protein
MIVGYFGRPFNKDHKSFTTKTHIVENSKVLCGYKPHKTLEFLWCAYNNLDYVECDKCKKVYNIKERN